jgi:hypothetical protein
MYAGRKTRGFLATIAIVFSYILLCGIIVGLIFKGNVYGGGGLLTSLIMIPVAIFLWGTITKNERKIKKLIVGLLIVIGAFFLLYFASKKSAQIVYDEYLKRSQKEGVNIPLNQLYGHQISKSTFKAILDSFAVSWYTTKRHFLGWQWMTAEVGGLSDEVRLIEERLKIIDRQIKDHSDPDKRNLVIWAVEQAARSSVYTAGLAAAGAIHPVLGFVLGAASMWGGVYNDLRDTGNAYAVIQLDNTTIEDQNVFTHDEPYFINNIPEGISLEKTLDNSDWKWFLKSWTVPVENWEMWLGRDRQATLLRLAYSKRVNR